MTISTETECFHLVTAFTYLFNGGCPQFGKGSISQQTNMGVWPQVRISVYPRMPLYCENFEKF